MSRSDWQIFEDLGESLPRALVDVLQEGADRALQDVRARMDFDHNTPGTGVRDSIRAYVDAQTLTLGISMPAHGWFQEFGVTSYQGKGRNDGIAIDNPLVSEAFRGADKFQFGTGAWGSGKPWGAYYSGLNAQQFLRIDQYIQQVTDYINNNLEEEWL
tara:strand:+ start:1725 stop:2198 length:474 start_codon:yes stop_codon:yes gene_type:complete